MRWRAQPSAIWLRHEFPVQRNKILSVGFVIHHPYGSGWSPSENPLGSERSVFGAGWGGLPQRSQRAQRIRWKGGGQLHRSFFLQLPWFSEKVSPQIPPPKKDWIRALTLYSPIANSKTPPHLCARLSGWKWGEQVEKAVAFSDALKLQARSDICAKSHIFMRQVRGGVKACGERGRWCQRDWPR